MTFKMKYIITFDEGHNEIGKLHTTYSDLKDLLEKNGYICKILHNFPITLDDLKDSSILVIASPDLSKFRNPEIKSIIDFVKLGGGLLIMSGAGGDPGHMSNLNDISGKFGIKFNNDQVIDKEINCGLPTIPKIKTFPNPHPIIKGISNLCYRAGCSLTVFNKAIPIALSNDISIPPLRPVIAVSQYGNGGIVAIGTYELFRSTGLGGIENPDHKKLALNIIEWFKHLVQKTVKPIIEIKEVEELTKPQMKKPLELKVKKLDEEGTLPLSLKDKVSAKISSSPTLVKETSPTYDQLIKLNRTIIKLLKEQKLKVEDNFKKIQEKLNKLENSLFPIIESNRKIISELNNLIENVKDIYSQEDISTIKRKLTLINSKLLNIKRTLEK